MRWLIDGYNVIRRSPELMTAERRSLKAGRDALCHRLVDLARETGDRFTVVFDGAGQGSGAGGRGPGVQIVFSSARETADRVLARMAMRGGAVVSNDLEVRRAAARAGAIAIDADRFLDRLDRRPGYRAGDEDATVDPEALKEEGPDAPRGPRKGNPRRLGKRARAAARALSRLR